MNIALRPSDTMEGGGLSLEGRASEDGLVRTYGRTGLTWVTLPLQSLHLLLYGLMASKT